jgi:malonyl CoA-acyl carrier protein transacylase
MAKDFYDEYAIARDLFDAASHAIDVDLAALIFAEDDPRLNLTEFTQPAILTVEMAIVKVIEQEYSKTASYFAGHSLGEYTALAASGVVDFVDAVRIVRKRGSLMQAAVPEGMGAMAALILEKIESSGYREIVKKHDADIANINSADQVVISGAKAAVEGAVAELREKIPGINAVFLNVSAPFHSRMMAPIEEEFRAYLTSFQIRPEHSSRVLSNFSGTFHRPETLIDHLVRQISGSVRWIENMQALIDTKASIVEVGPNRPLGKFFSTLGVEVPSVLNVKGMKKVFS